MTKKRLNLRKVIAIAICLAGSAIVFAQETGVVINGVKWATRNVDKPGTFAENPESSGMFYQWNRIQDWQTADWTVTRWNSAKNTGIIWERSNDPSPDGWRLPTFEEIEKLLDKEKVNNEFKNVNGVWGNRFTDITTGNSIFIPFVGSRDRADGSKSTVGSGYWSSSHTESDHISILLLAFNQAVKAGSDRNSGLLVRCVSK